MATKQKIYIPTYISSVTYQPARVQPRILFYNSTKNCETYYIASGSAVQAQESFPYFDNYSGTNTTSDSLSLLFNNEDAPYGVIPSQSLYTTYWERYVDLLYNPRTRLLNAQAIIPLAKYFEMELNDIVQWRGNTYHLRAINDYNLSTGECSIQLLGPILEGALYPEEFSPYPPPPPEPTQYSYTRYNVSAECSQSAATNVWSYDILSDGYYIISSSLKYLVTSSHSTRTTQIVGATPSSCTPVPAAQYTYVRYDLSPQCSQSNATNVWSYNSYANGYWASGGTTYYLATGSHSTFTTNFNGTASSCTPVPATQYTYTRYDVDALCTQSNATNVWSYNSYADGLYTISSAKKYLATGSHSTFTTEIISATPTTCTPATLYYKIDACDAGSASLYTSIAPVLSTQRYIDYVTTGYYVWDNTNTISPGTIGGNIQLVSGQQNCPTGSPTPPPPPPPPPVATYSFLLAYDASSGAGACSNYNTYTNMSAKWSVTSSIASGVYLYNSQNGAETSNSGDYVTNGYYSNGTKYWYFASGNTGDAGTNC